MILDLRRNKLGALSDALAELRANRRNTQFYGLVSYLNLSPEAQRAVRYDVGDETVGVAANGHKMVYTVIRYYQDGSAWTRSYNAYCTDDCRACASGEVLPDW